MQYINPCKIPKTFFVKLKKFRKNRYFWFAVLNNTFFLFTIRTLNELLKKVVGCVWVVRVPLSRFPLSIRVGKFFLKQIFFNGTKICKKVPYSSVYYKHLRSTAMFKELCVVRYLNEEATMYNWLIPMVTIHHFFSRTFQVIKTFFLDFIHTLLELCFGIDKLDSMTTISLLVQTVTRARRCSFKEKTLCSIRFYWLHLFKKYMVFLVMGSDLGYVPRPLLTVVNYSKDFSWKKY